MRRALGVLIVMLLAIDTADACHHYSIWHYPQAQSCGFAPHRVTALAPRAVRLPQRRINVSVISDQRLVHRPVETPEIALPSLADIEWGHLADDDVRGRILLRAILQEKEREQ